MPTRPQDTYREEPSRGPPGPPALLGATSEEARSPRAGQVPSETAQSPSAQPGETTTRPSSTWKQDDLRPSHPISSISSISGTLDHDLASRCQFPFQLLQATGRMER